MSRYLSDGYEEEKETSETKEKSVEEQIDKVLKGSTPLRKMDEHNPMEQAIKFQEVRKNPPKKGYMKVECYEALDDDGNKWICSKSNGPDGIKWIKHKPFFVTDLYQAIMSNVATCPANVGPMLIDQGMKQIDLEKKQFKPQKRRDDNKMMALIMIIMVTVMAGAGAFAIFQFF